MSIGTRILWVTRDVHRLLEIFRKEVGRTWAEATSRNSVSHVTEGPGRQTQPWREVENVMRRAGDDAPHVYVRQYVTRLTPFFAWNR